MTKTVAIAGSASLQSQAEKWKSYFDAKGYRVIASPQKLQDVTREYPDALVDFFNAIDAADILFVMNEDKNDINGYIGPAVFAETCHVIARNQQGVSKTEVIFCKKPSADVACYEEVSLWLEYGWAKVIQDTV